VSIVDVAGDCPTAFGEADRDVETMGIAPASMVTLRAERLWDEGGIVTSGGGDKMRSDALLTSLLTLLAVDVVLSLLSVVAVEVRWEGGDTGPPISAGVTVDDDEGGSCVECWALEADLGGEDGSGAFAAISSRCNMAFMRLDSSSSAVYDRLLLLGVAEEKGSTMACP